MDVGFKEPSRKRSTSPLWREMFNETFEGASTGHKDDEGWRSMLGFDEIIIDGLWHKYGVRIRQGEGPLDPLRWMWLFAYLKQPGSWMTVAFTWRAPCTTFTTAVNDIIDQLQSILEEVRV